MFVHRSSGTAYPPVPRVHGRGGTHPPDLDLYTRSVHHGQGRRLLTLLLLPYVVKDLSHCILFLLNRIFVFGHSNLSMCLVISYLLLSSYHAVINRRFMQNIRYIIQSIKAG